MLKLQNALTDIGVLDCNIKTLYKNKGRSTHLISGNLPWNCHNAVIKTMDVKYGNEIMFYKEPLLSSYRPEVYFTDKHNRFVVMEYVRVCNIWNGEFFKQAIQFMAEMHSVYWDKTTILPGWIPKVAPVSEKQVRDFCYIVDNYMPDKLSPYSNLLKAGAEKVKTLFDSVLQSPFTLIHNDFMYVNMGFGKSGLVLFDWSALMLAPAAYEFCYSIFQFEEVFGIQTDKELLMDCYLASLQKHNIMVDKAKFKRDCIISYLHKCLFSYIQHYLLNSVNIALERKVPVVCDMIKHQLKELRKVTTDVDNSVSTKMKKLSQIFDSDYFENGVQSKKSNYKDYSWERLGSYFQRTAQHIVDVFSPQKALDVGCAKGFLVKALQDLGVNAKGIDPSEYALSKAISKGVKLGIAQKIPGKANQYDLVICFDVLEHLPESEVPLACKELLRVAKKNVIVRVPTKVEERDLEKTHETIRPKDWWEHKFVEAGGTVNEISAILDKGTWWFNVPECLIWIEK